jgi:hypothetical protein
MSSMQKMLKWILPALALVILLAAVFFIHQASQRKSYFPPCEAMRPYIEYHDTVYVATSKLASSDLGSAITTIGTGKDQAQSCMPEGITVYTVKGSPSTTHLAAHFQGLTLFEAVHPTPAPSASPGRQ